MIGFRKVKREWGEIWESNRSWPLEVLNKKLHTLFQIVSGIETFKYEGDWTNRFADRPLRFRFKEDEEAKIVQVRFYDQLGWFDD